MEKPPKNYYHDQISDCVFSDIEESKNSSIDGAASNLFDAIRRETGASAKDADALWNDRKRIIKHAKTLISVLTDPSKFITVYKPHGRPEHNS